MTALKAHEVEQFLQAPGLPSGVFVAYGPDAGLVKETIGRLIQHYAGENPDPMAHTILDGQEIDAEPSRLAMEARTPSLFGGKRTIRVRGTSKTLVQALKALLEDMPDAIIAVEATNLKPADALRKLAEASKIARALPCYADNEKTLNDLIRRAFNEANISHPPEVISTLKDLLGNDREVTRRELEKLVLFAWESKKITVEDIITLCGDNSSQAIDAIVDAVGSGQAAKFDEEFQSATTSGADPQRILAVAMMHFSNLRRLRTKVDGGMSPKEVLNGSRPRPHFSRMNAMERQLRLWTDETLNAACNRIYTAILDSRKSAPLSLAITQRALLAICVSAAHR